MGFLFFLAGFVSLRLGCFCCAGVSVGFVRFRCVLCGFGLVSAGLAAFCVVLGWSLLVLFCFGIISAGLAAFCVVLCGFGPVSAGFCWSRCVLCGFGLVSASLAVFVWFCVVLG